jgi:hypothetical protein
MMEFGCSKLLDDTEFCQIMRLLVILCHYYGPKSDGQSAAIYSSQIDPLARIAAVNAAIVALHRHFGPRRYGADPLARLPEDRTPARVLDIIILQVPGRGLLEAIGIDPTCYTVEYFDGPPLMLCFEAQRLLRERLGGYDRYGVIEDDMIIYDPLFFEKQAWFEQAFGPGALLHPIRYEMAQSGVPAMVTGDPILSERDLAPFRRANQRERLSGNWNGREQTFRRPRNPHTSCYFVSDAQLRRWIETPWFYDRDTSWVGPLESAMTLSIGRSFDLYNPAAPDPFFLAIEHYGTRYARRVAPQGVIYGDEPLLEIAHRALQRRPLDAADDPHGMAVLDPISSLLADSGASLNALVCERDAILFELWKLKHSRSRLFKSLMSALLRKTVWRKR